MSDHQPTAQPGEPNNEVPPELPPSARVTSDDTEPHSSRSTVDEDVPDLPPTARTERSQVEEEEEEKSQSDANQPIESSTSASSDTTFSIHLLTPPHAPRSNHLPGERTAPTTPAVGHSPPSHSRQHSPLQHSPIIRRVATGPIVCDYPPTSPSSLTVNDLLTTTASQQWAIEQGESIAQLLAEWNGTLSMSLRRPSLPPSIAPTPRTLNASFSSMPNSYRANAGGTGVNDFFIDSAAPSLPSSTTASAAATPRDGNELVGSGSLKLRPSLAQTNTEELPSREQLLQQIKTLTEQLQASAATSAAPPPTISAAPTPTIAPSSPNEAAISVLQSQLHSLTSENLALQTRLKAIDSLHDQYEQNQLQLGVFKLGMEQAADGEKLAREAQKRAEDEVRSVHEMLEEAHKTQARLQAELTAQTMKTPRMLTARTPSISYESDARANLHAELEDLRAQSAADLQAMRQVELDRLAQLKQAWLQEQEAKEAEWKEKEKRLLTLSQPHILLKEPAEEKVGPSSSPPVESSLTDSERLDQQATVAAELSQLRAAGQAALVTELESARRLAMAQLEEELENERESRLTELHMREDARAAEVEAIALKEEKQLNTFKVDRIAALSEQISTEVAEIRARKLAELEDELTQLRMKRMNGQSDDDPPHGHASSNSMDREAALAELHAELAQERRAMEVEFESTQHRLAAELVQMRDTKLHQLRLEQIERQQTMQYELESQKQDIKRGWFKDWGAQIHQWLQAAKERSLPIDSLIDELGLHLQSLAAERERRNLKKVPITHKPKPTPNVGLSMPLTSRQTSRQTSRLTSPSASQFSSPSKATTVHGSLDSSARTSRSNSSINEATLTAALSAHMAQQVAWSNHHRAISLSEEGSSAASTATSSSSLDGAGLNGGSDTTSQPASVASTPRPNRPPPPRPTQMNQLP